MELLQSFMIFVAAGLALGGMAAGFYGARQKGIIELLKTENTAYKDSNQRLHDENTELRQQKATAEAEAKIWRDNVTQRPSVEKLIAAITKQHGEYMIKMGEITAALKEIRRNGK